MQQRKLTARELLVLTSLIFGLFFGAGNLIFPVQLGQGAGSTWPLATLGFLLTGSVVPFLALLAVAVTRSRSVYDLAAPVAPWFATTTLVLLHFTIGPLSGTPRTAAVAFDMGVAPLLPAGWRSWAMLGFSALFFGLAYLLTVKQSRFKDWIGKYLNPLFLLLLALVLLLALCWPMGSLTSKGAAAYQQQALVHGLLDGYGTMDGIALLAVAVSVVYAVEGMGFHKKQVPGVLAKAGFLSILLEGLIYTGLVLLGVSSLGSMAAADNGGLAFAAIVVHYLGKVGVLVTGIIVTLTVFTTAMGLFVSFAQDLHRAFPRVSYLFWLRLIALGSFVTANAGLTKLVTWTTPVLLLLYPFALSLIALAVTNRWTKQAPILYRTVMLAVAGPALLDALGALPFLATWGPLQGLLQAYQQLPLAANGFGWCLPALLGLVVGLLLTRFFGKGTGVNNH
ncbi:branched-chain amino acid transport system II carrier protein [Leuconostocaceae bacterium ESL0958]|nr:branched-chain amino acid transport system II carrier protein [Leuconostocaceae bacterium ESL0958]